MTHQQKKQVKDALLRYTSKFDTQAEAAQSLNGISASTISQIKNHNWDMLSDSLWQQVARQVGFYCGDWQAADTSATLLLRILIGDAQRYTTAYGIALAKGLGKTFTATQYAHENENVIYISGDTHYNRKTFLNALLRIVNESPIGTAPQMLKQLSAIICGKDQPVLIIDDAHLLKDRVLHLVVLLANSVTDKAGFILMGNETLRMRIIDGVRLKKPGFEEIYKLIGKRFITLNYLAPADVAAVCHANGLHDEELISYIQENSHNNLHATTCLIGQHLQQSIAA